MDDLIALVQGGKRGHRRLRRVLFHTIGMVSRAPDADDDEWKADPIFCWIHLLFEWDEKRQALWWN